MRPPVGNRHFTRGDLRGAALACLPWLHTKFAVFLAIWELAPALETSVAHESIDVSIALDRIAAAYRLVQLCSIDKLGLSMVDFRQSCCNCAPLTARGS